MTEKGPLKALVDTASLRSSYPTANSRVALATWLVSLQNQQKKNQDESSIVNANVVLEILHRLPRQPKMCLCENVTETNKIERNPKQLCRAAVQVRPGAETLALVGLTAAEMHCAVNQALKTRSRHLSIRRVAQTTRIQPVPTASPEEIGRDPFAPSFLMLLHNPSLSPLFQSVAIWYCPAPSALHYLVEGLRNPRALGNGTLKELCFGGIEDPTDETLPQYLPKLISALTVTGKTFLTCLRLEYLDNLSSVHGNLVAELVEKCGPTLETISLSGCPQLRAAFPAILSKASPKSLRLIRLVDCSLRCQDICNLLLFLKSSHFQCPDANFFWPLEFDLTANSIGPSASDFFQLLAQTPFKEKIGGLSLNGQSLDNPSVAALFCFVTSASKLCALELEGCFEKDFELAKRFLVSCKRAKSLRRLNLRTCSFAGTSTRHVANTFKELALAEPPTEGQLMTSVSALCLFSLDLGGNLLGASGVQALLASGFPLLAHLEVLKLDFCELKDEGIAMLASLIERTQNAGGTTATFPKKERQDHLSKKQPFAHSNENEIHSNALPLRILSLENNEFSDSSLTTLSRVASKCLGKIETLSLRGNTKITGPGSLKPLSTLLQTCKMLQGLLLAGCDFAPADVMALATHGLQLGLPASNPQQAQLTRINSLAEPGPPAGFSQFRHICKLDFSPWARPHELDTLHTFFGKAPQYAMILY